MQNTYAFERDWRDRGLGRPLRREMTFTHAGLVLGRGTILAEFGKEGLAARGLAFDGEEARLLSLLTAAYRQPVSGGAIEKIRRAGEFWRAGEKALAQIHLAFLGLRKIGEADAYRLFLAGTALEKGASPRDLMKALGFPRAARDIEKYSPDQPRVPAGSGRESGEWTTGGGDGAGRTTFVRRVEISRDGATMSDANPPGIVAGAQYAQASTTPILTQDTINKILRDHGPEWSDPEKGRFTGKYATEEGIRTLIADLWKEATPDDLALPYGGRVIIAASSHVKIDGKIYDDYVGFSGDRTEIIELTGEFGTPSVKTNLYIVILDSDMRVISCYPINPLDLRNLRNLPND
jgi:hypothetical protein